MDKGTPTKLTSIVLPIYFLYLESSGFTATAVSPSFVSGLVVAIVMGKSLSYLK